MARIQVSIDLSGRIIVSSPYDPLIVEKVKTINGRRWHHAEKHWVEHFFESAPWSFLNKNATLEKILMVFEGEEICLDPALKTATSKTKDTPSPLGGEGWGEGYNFRDLGRELIS